MAESTSRIVAALAGALLLVGCSSGGAAQSLSKTPTPQIATSPTPATVITKDTPIGELPIAVAIPWIRRNADVVPPTGYLATVEVPNATNSTNGAVSDPDIKKWTEGFVRSQLWELWALKNKQRQFLASNISVSGGAAEVFAQDFEAIDKANARKGVIHVHLGHPYPLKLIAVPADTQQTITSAGAGATPYAFVLDDIGPADMTVVYPDGTSETIFTHGPGLFAHEFVGGVYKEDPLLGGLWLTYSDYNCNSNFLAKIC